MISDDLLREVLFPFESARPIQDQLIADVWSGLSDRKNLVIHAPTGLGKTAATLPAALALAVKNNLVVFFLTSRQTQHQIATQTLRSLQTKYGTKFIGVDLVAKRSMCLQEGAKRFGASEFLRWCKQLRIDNQCEYYSGVRTKSALSTVLTPKAEQFVRTLEERGMSDISSVVELGRGYGLCPYEVSLILAKKATVFIADYNYLFHAHIRESFLGKIDKELSRAIIIVDEAHNLPRRVQDMMSKSLSSVLIARAMKEAHKYQFAQGEAILHGLGKILVELSEQSREEEYLVTRDQFTGKIARLGPLEEVKADLQFVADEILIHERESAISSIVEFLDFWSGPDDGYARIFSKKQGRVSSLSLSYRCLDPAILSRPLIKESYSTILMSGTLTPTSMYRQLLGFGENTRELSYPNPFPAQNRRTMVVPLTTTKFTERSSQMFDDIAVVCADVVNSIPGNTALFFPSYSLLTEVFPAFLSLSQKIVFSEEQDMPSEKREELLGKFKSAKDVGAVLCGVISGSFYEGIDLPGNLLCGVVIVGLPLQPPDCYTKELIAYYDTKYQRGWDWGYLFPAFNKCLQTAGRCIRSETDRGVIVFLDRRYVWPNYFRCFPPDMELKITKDYKGIINSFFGRDTQSPLFLTASEMIQHGQKNL